MVDVSLVVCTRNRSDQLQDALAKLLELKPKVSWEVVIVNNGSTDATATILETFRQRSSCPFTVVYEPQPGLGRARNRGWRAANGNLIAFTDDDCYPAPDFVDAIPPCFSDPAVGYVGGKILLYDPTDLPITIQLLDELVELKPRQFIPAGLIQGANFSFRKATLEAIGGFDDHFGAGTAFPCEDVDVLARASGAGWAGTSDPRPCVYHHHRRKTKEEMKRLMRGYDVGRGAYYVKYVLDPTLRHIYMKTWGLMLVTQSPARTLRELKGGLLYLKKRWE
jgi:glycosyltransferase involved in cell wall biosynthesis